MIDTPELTVSTALIGRVMTLLVNVYVLVNVLYDI